MSTDPDKELLEIKEENKQKSAEEIKRQRRERHLILDQMELTGDGNSPIKELDNDAFASVLAFCDFSMHNSILGTSKSTMAYYMNKRHPTFKNMSYNLYDLEISYSHRRFSLWSLMACSLHRLTIRRGCKTETHISQLENPSPGEGTLDISIFRNLKHLSITGNLVQLKNVLEGCMNLAENLEALSLLVTTDLRNPRSARRSIEEQNLIGRAVQSIETFVLKCVNMEHLDCATINQETTRIFTRSMLKMLFGGDSQQKFHKLRRLYFNNICPEEDDVHTRTDLSLKKLTFLCRFGGEQLKRNYLPNKFSDKFQEDLEYLKVNMCSFQRYFGVQQLKNLREIHLVNRSPSYDIPDDFVIPSVQIVKISAKSIDEKIFKYFPSVKNLTCCSGGIIGYRDKMEVTLSPIFQKLESLKLVGCHIKKIVSHGQVPKAKRHDEKCKLFRMLLAIPKVCIRSCSLAVDTRILGITIMEDIFPENGKELMHEFLKEYEGV